jgi:2',3'-cyclic-nucleotide 2'-phosphodiesterase (5'-nucleotidase family)
LARRATFIDSVRALNPNTLVVEAGDFSDVNPTYGAMKNDFIVRMMSRIGYDAVTLGERDLRWSATKVEEQLGETALLMNNVSVVENGSRKPLGSKPLIRDMDGVRVGTFGLVHENVVAKGGDSGDPLVADDVFESADRIVAELENEQCDIIVFLAQMELAFADSIIRRHPEIDLAVLGHRGGLRATHSTVGNTIVVRAGRRGQYIGAVDLVVNPAGEIVEYGGRTIALDKQTKDPAILALANDLEAEMTRLRKEQEALRQAEYQNQQEVDRYLGANTCARCHQPEFEQWQASAHANAWQTLVDLGMDASDDCVSCHVTGYGETTGFKSARMKPDLTNVQCEACHQMGTMHEAGGAPQAHEAASTCAGCHDQTNSPDFNLDSYLEAIRHW